MINSIRYILFLPLSLVASILISSVVQFVGSMLFGNLIGWIVCGLFGGVTFLIVGIQIVPNKTELGKNILVTCLFILSILSVIGGFTTTEYNSSIWAGLSALLISVAAFSTPVNEMVNKTLT